ncbi:hypothetical protein DAPPUDRAFT_243816 [Daphnia pulex]|uniref:Uncharacterized protein n=1 Tax=Daphnia pulex TaxID=6669 RepID=E9GK66_DAPPU|nr:hypothetical protein DAPPUDRAFT_243816 [Daphnia pulex]|eukprot:EFX80296.1 hypothetical protein DAPPUDRAFT_243816 [Daphnia pulex]
MKGKIETLEKEKQDREPSSSEEEDQEEAEEEDQQEDETVNEEEGNVVKVPYVPTYKEHSENEIEEYKKKKNDFTQRRRNFLSAKKLFLKRNVPDSAREGIRYLLGIFYSPEYILLHRKTNTRARVGEDLKEAMDLNELYAISRKC